MLTTVNGVKVGPKGRASHLNLSACFACAAPLININGDGVGPGREKQLIQHITKILALGYIRYSVCLPGVRLTFHSLICQFLAYLQDIAREDRGQGHQYLSLYLFFFPKHLWKQRIHPHGNHVVFMIRCKALGSCSIIILTHRSHDVHRRID